MDANKEHVPSENLETDDDISIVLELPENDHLFEKKKKLLQDLCHYPKGHITLKSSFTPEQLKHVLEIILQKARIINLDEIDLYFGGADASSFGSNSPRNELEALNLILRTIDNSISNHKPKTINVLQHLRDATVDLIHGFGKKVGEETRVVTGSTCEKEKALLQWGKSNGISRKLEIAYVEGAGRGAIAKEDLKIGDTAIEIPESLIISDKLLLASDLAVLLLKKIEGILPETMLLLWTMKERHNCDSKFKLYYDTLPTEFNTGLSFTVHAFMALDGTSLLEEIVQTKEHLRNEFEELFPFLSDNHPDVFPPEFYTWEQFLWACELWYSNSMKVMFNDGKLRTCLVPIAGFLNHSTCPHITRYGKMDPVTNSLKFPLSRPCNAGEECFLSYGNFSSSHLLTFYGFLPRQDNPYDVISLDIDIALEEEDCEGGALKCEWNTHMVRGTWFSKNHGIFNYGLPPPLLDHLRKAWGFTAQTETHVKLEIEREILVDLRSTSEGMLDALGETDFDDRETASWDVKLALDFKDLQRRIISSVIDSCNAGLMLLESELGKSAA